MLTGVPAGEPEADGRYPDESVNAAVFAVLGDMARRRREFTAGGAGKAEA